MELFKLESKFNLVKVHFLKENNDGNALLEK